VVTRRQFILRAGAGTVGLAAGAAGGAFLVQDDDEVRDRATAAAQQRFSEAGGAADAGEQVARLGTHRVVWSTTIDQPSRPSPSTTARHRTPPRGSWTPLDRAG